MRSLEAAAAIRWPLGLKATEYNGFVQGKTKPGRPEAASQTTTLPSSPADATRRPSGLNATLLVEPQCRSRLSPSTPTRPSVSNFVPLILSAATSSEGIFAGPSWSSGDGNFISSSAALIAADVPPYLPLNAA